MRKLHGNRTRCKKKKKKFTWTDNTLKGKKKVGKITYPMPPFTIHSTIIEWQCYALNIQNNLILNEHNFRKKIKSILPANMHIYTFL